jgi:hypothetical protein
MVRNLFCWAMEKEVEEEGFFPQGDRGRLVLKW